MGLRLGLEWKSCPQRMPASENSGIWQRYHQGRPLSQVFSSMVPLLLLTDAFFAQKTILYSLYKSPVIAAENCEHNKPGKAVDNVGHRRPGECKNRRLRGGRLPLASSFAQGSRRCAYRLDRCFILQRASTAAEKMKNTRAALEEHN